MPSSSSVATFGSPDVDLSRVRATLRPAPRVRAAFARSLFLCLLVLAHAASATAAAPADPEGASLFTQHCMICHVAAGAGQDFGPNLSDAGLRLTRDAIRQSILTPSQTITEGYAQVEVMRRDGQILIGIEGPKSAGTVIVKQLAGVLHRIPENEVISTKVLPVSAMEAVQKLTQAEIEAVTDYVLTLKQPVARPPVGPPPEFQARGAPRWLLLLAGGFTLLFGAFVIRNARQRAAA